VVAHAKKSAKIYLINTLSLILQIVVLAMSYWKRVDMSLKCQNLFPGCSVVLVQIKLTAERAHTVYSM